MGSVISQAANGIGGLLGSAITAPFKTLYCSSTYYSRLGSVNALEEASVRCVGLHVRHIGMH
ncbi:hypothetical protein TorRG33x02_165070 [Trema orientale]|uniref:Uncharacterized protein n=1 Tax=Trema orientale TaxID=63057 RepID=A0A2P5EQ30_TREOI|nr:hypothetical protein TorRG33x02_165070 [Trema orientale]